jgi:CRISPR-associated protein Cmr4
MYTLYAKTNLHAGSGSTNYGVIDNLVQKDPVDELPCIYASSLKGALREYFEEVTEKGRDKKPISEGIFGPINTGTLKKGSHIFHEALLLSLPVRSNRKPFYNATAPFVLQRFLDSVQMFALTMPPALQNEIAALIALAPAENRPIVLQTTEANHLLIEEFDAFATNNTPLSNQLQSLLGRDVVLMADADFKYQCSDACLPIIARNNLENGVSRNLWYEQIVPREARFYFFTSTNESNDAFATEIALGQYVQVGANASIGYGKCFIQPQNITA